MQDTALQVDIMKNMKKCVISCQRARESADYVPEIIIDRQIALRAVRDASYVTQNLEIT